MAGEMRFTDGQKVRGLVVAALVTWSAITLISLAPAIYAVVLHPRETGDIGLANAFVLFAIFGLPIAAITCLVAGLPAWVIAERLGAHSPVHSALLGAMAGLLVGCVLTAYFAFSDSDPGYNYSAGDHDLVVKGVKTSHWWWGQAVFVLELTATGLIAGFAARLGAGAPHQANASSGTG